METRYVVRSFDRSAERADLQALLGHESLDTTPIDFHVGQARMEQVVGRL